MLTVDTCRSGGTCRVSCSLCRPECTSPGLSVSAAAVSAMSSLLTSDDTSGVPTLDAAAVASVMRACTPALMRCAFQHVGCATSDRDASVDHSTAPAVITTHRMRCVILTLLVVEGVVAVTAAGLDSGVVHRFFLLGRAADGSWQSVVS